MEILIYLIPIITVAVLVWKFRKETAWWEYIIVVIPSLLLFALLKSGMIYCNSLDTEYLGDIISKITYYEEWDETVMVEHTYTTKEGDREVTHTEMVPERRYHPEEYIYVTITGDKGQVSKKTYNKIINKFHVNPVFKDMHRNYRSIDGDAYVYTWNGSKQTSYPITETHQYVNKVKASSYSIFKYSNLTEKEIKENKLFEYPNIIGEDQNTVLGRTIPDSISTYVRYFNGYRGPRNQIRLFILCFNNPSLEVAEMQKAYWQGGNKNELVVCLGLKGNKVIWCDSFSWCDEPILEVKTRDYFIHHPNLDIKSYINWLDPLVDKNWHRKSFKDFNYIDIGLTTGEYICILILILLYNIGISYWVITNEYTEDDPDGSESPNYKLYKRYKYKRYDF